MTNINGFELGGMLAKIAFGFNTSPVGGLSGRTSKDDKPFDFKQPKPQFPDANKFDKSLKKETVQIANKSMGTDTHHKMPAANKTPKIDVAKDQVPAGPMELTVPPMLPQTNQETQVDSTLSRLENILSNLEGQNV